MHVLEPLPHRFKPLVGPLAHGDLEEIRREGARKALAREVARVRWLGTVESFLAHGRPWYEVLETARAWGADLLCLGNSGRTRLDRLLLGSKAENVVRRSPVPVLVTRDLPLRRLERILVPLDFDEGSRRALRFAVERLPATARVAALHVLPPPTYLEPYSSLSAGTYSPPCRGGTKKVR